MTKAIVFFERSRERMLPLAFTRPLSHFRIGIHSIQKKWELQGYRCSNACPDYLSANFPASIGDDQLFIDASLLPSKAFFEEVTQLVSGEALVSDGEVLAYRSEHFKNSDELKHRQVMSSFLYLKNPWDLFLMNAEALQWDFDELGESPQSLSSTNTLIGSEIYIEEGAKVTASILNAEAGPIYIGKNAEVMEGAIIRGPFALGESSVVKMGAKIYGPTTLGPHCKVGGEVSNSIFFGYSNKGHDGFVGNSVIGEWCNFGADTNVSNLKNNYSNVRVWSYEAQALIESGEQFCGLIMGDHSKTSINSMFNTGTVVGVCSNIFGSGFPSKFIPSFSCGFDGEVHKINKAQETASKVMARRSIELTDEERSILSWIFDHDQP